MRRSVCEYFPKGAPGHERSAQSCVVTVSRGTRRDDVCKTHSSNSAMHRGLVNAQCSLSIPTTASTLTTAPCFDRPPPGCGSKSDIPGPEPNALFGRSTNFWCSKKLRPVLEKCSPARRQGLTILSASAGEHGQERARAATSYQRAPGGLETDITQPGMFRREFFVEISRRPPRAQRHDVCPTSRLPPCTG